MEPMIITSYPPKNIPTKKEIDDCWEYRKKYGVPVIIISTKETESAEAQE